MYPVKLGYDEAVARVRRLLLNDHVAEAFVAAVFTLEKTLRRTLRQLVISAGFTSELADSYVRELTGIGRLKGAWRYFDPQARTLASLIEPTDWHFITSAAKKRNHVVHGQRVYKLDEYRGDADRALDVLQRLKARLDDEYGYSGWTIAASRKRSALHADPKVRIRYPTPLRGTRTSTSKES